MLNVFHKLTDLFSCDLAIDLGSTNTLIYRKGTGLLVNEPTLIAFQRNRTGEHTTIRTGVDAKELLGRHPDDVIIVKPVQYGAVTDFSAARKMLISYLERIKRTWCPTQVRVITNVPAKASDEEKASISELVRSAGAREVYLMEQPRALAIGAGLDLSEEKGSMVVDIGGAITEMAIIAEGKVICARSLHIGGEHMDQAIVAYVREQHDLLIHTHVAEQIKIRIGDANAPEKKISFLVEGYHVATGKPGFAEVTAQDICEALSDTLTSIISAIGAFLGSLTAQQNVDILDRGIVLAGGSALLRNLDRRLERELLFPFLKVKDPLTCLVLGVGDTLDYLKHFRQREKL